MIERLLAAERALADGRLDQAEHLFRQVAEADERNAIAVVGLAEVALARGDRPEALALAGRALAIDPDDAAAARLLEAPAPVMPEAPATSMLQAEGSPQPVAPAGGAAARRPASLGARLRSWFARLVGRSTDGSDGAGGHGGADGAGGAAPR